MPVRQTSIETYRKIESDGLLSKRRFEVYSMLFDSGPLTANEIVRHSKQHYPNTNPSSFHARLSELKRLGVAVEVGTKQDPVSGNRCYIWDVTDKLPIKIEREFKLPKHPKCPTCSKATEHNLQYMCTYLRHYVLPDFYCARYEKI